MKRNPTRISEMNCLSVCLSNFSVYRKNLLALQWERQGSDLLLLQPQV